MRPDIPAIIEALCARDSNWLADFHHYEGDSIFMPNFFRLTRHDFLEIVLALGWKPSPDGVDSKEVSVLYSVGLRP